jgi:signal peptidase I
MRFPRFFRRKEEEDILLCDIDEDTELTADEAEEEDKPEEKPNWKKTLLVYVHDILYLLAALVIISLVLRVVVVKGTSMNNTLKDGDYLLVLSNVFYRNPKQGDVIVASKETFDNGAPIVKRIIAVEGQKVDIDFAEGVVYVDDVPLDEPYTLTPTSLYEGIDFPLIVGENSVFVLGDNRNGSRDSRHPDIGLIDKREIIGKVIFLFIPGNNGVDYAGNPRESRDFSRIGVVN